METEGGSERKRAVQFEVQVKSRYLSHNKLEAMI